MNDPHNPQDAWRDETVGFLSLEPDVRYRLRGVGDRGAVRVTLQDGTPIVEVSASPAGVSAEFNLPRTWNGEVRGPSIPIRVQTRDGRPHWSVRTAAIPETSHAELDAMELERATRSGTRIDVPRP